MAVRPIFFAMAGACMLAGCVAGGEQAGGSASLTPSLVNPGQPVTVTYTVEPRPGAAITAVEIVGLPPNASIAPSATPGARSIDVRLPVPTRAGSYPLQLKLVASSGQATLLPVGTLVVNRMPGRLVEAAITPAAHSVGACTAATRAASLSYTVESPNGAAAVAEIRLLPTELAAAVPMLPRTPLVLRNPEVLAAPPQAAEARGFTVRPLAAVAAPPRQVASAAGAGAPLAGAGALLPPSPRWDVARDRLSTEIEIPCALPAPTVWRVPLVGIVGGAQATNRLDAQYRVDP